MANPYPINPVLRLTVKLWMSIFQWYYNISANISPRLRKFDEPYLLLANHTGRYDPFIISHFIKKRPNFISSDAILRDKFIGTIFKGLGAMPKKKGFRDSVIIREMVKVVQNGGALSLFPEGTRTWSGETMYMDPSIAKLVKLLKVPVVTAKIKGGSAFDPRWAQSIRRAEMEIDFRLAIEKDEVGQLSDDEIFSIIQHDLYQDDSVYLRSKRTKIKSSKRAEHIDRILFQCPGCLSFKGFVDKANTFSCKECGHTYFVNEHGILRAEGETAELPFDNIKAWLDWQNKNFVEFVREKIRANCDTSLFYADKMHIECAIGDGRMQSMGIGEVYFYLDKVVIKTSSHSEELLVSEISSFGPQFNERIELFYEDRAYRFSITDKREPGIKWEIAISVIWANIGLARKIAPYFKHLVTANTS
jgi:1-acyl-sn-glycerol-3-phosphate acyltransferase